MTTGAVIFALNNQEVDYIKLAIFAANKIKKYLNIPVSVIVDWDDYILSQYPNHGFDKIISIGKSEIVQSKKFNDGSFSSKVMDWKNYERCSIYNLTPYDRTLVIDSDYILNSAVLKPALTNDYEFQIYRKSIDLALDRDSKLFDRINSYSIPFYWATVFIFKKTPLMESFFNLIAYIKNNWNYFRTLYSIDSFTFRNDFAFSIAIHIMNGKTEGGFAIELPGNMIFTADKDLLISAKDNKMQFLVEKKNHLGEYIAVKTTGLDVHVMNKFSLSRFIDGGLGV
jgi:hypothetical protein